MLLRKYHHVVIAANDAALYTLCLQLHKTLILTAILLKNLQNNLGTMFIQKIEISA